MEDDIVEAIIDDEQHDIDKRSVRHHDCYPGEGEIMKLISLLYAKEKARSSSATVSTRTSLPAALETRVRELHAEFPHLSGKPLEAKVASSYDGNLPPGYDRKLIMSRVNAWRAATRKKAAEKQRKLLIG